MAIDPVQFGIPSLLSCLKFKPFVQDIVKKIAELRTEKDANLPKITAIDVDCMLWHYRRSNSAEIDNRVGFLRSRSLYY